MKPDFSPESPRQESDARQRIMDTLRDGPDQSSPEKMLQWAKGRALEYAKEGQLREAIDSMLSDLGKDPSRNEMQMQMIGMMALSLRSKADLSKAEVIEWINGFN